MITYKAMYRFLPGGWVHAEVLDYPGVITCARSQEDARRDLRGALVDMAESDLLDGRPLPTPDPSRTHPQADLEEPVVVGVLPVEEA